jgi:hypothetical protein
MILITGAAGYALDAPHDRLPVRGDGATAASEFTLVEIAVAR